MTIEKLPLRDDCRVRARAGGGDYVRAGGCEAACKINVSNASVSEVGPVVVRRERGDRGCRGCQCQDECMVRCEMPEYSDEPIPDARATTGGDYEDNLLNSFSNLSLGATSGSPSTAIFSASRCTRASSNLDKCSTLAVSA